VEDERKEIFTVPASERPLKTATSLGEPVRIEVDVGRVGKLRRVRRDEGWHLWARRQQTRDVRLAEVGDLISTATSIEEDGRDAMDVAGQRLDAVRCVAQSFVRVVIRSIEKRIVVWSESGSARFAE
jgi:hypothetical protein